MVQTIPRPRLLAALRDRLAGFARSHQAWGIQLGEDNVVNGLEPAFLGRAFRGPRGGIREPMPSKEPVTVDNKSDYFSRIRGTSSLAR